MNSLFGEDMELCNFEEESKASKTLKEKRHQDLVEELKKPKKKRAWQFTLNEVDKWDKLRTYLESLKSLKYGIACKELAPSTGHPHIHAYCQFKNMFRPSYQCLEGAHAEGCNGKPEENLDYIYKRGKYADKANPDGKADIIWETGEFRGAGKPKETIRDLKECPIDELDDMPIGFYEQVKQEKVRRSCNIKPENWYSPKTIFYIHGNSGKGKSAAAMWLMEKLGIQEFENIKVDKSGFYHGSNMETGVALYDDFRDSDTTPKEFINMIDYNSHTMNIKFGSLVNHYKTIFITSVQSPRTLWSGMQDKKGEESAVQWLRRIDHCIYIADDCTPYEQNPTTGETLEIIQGGLKEHLEKLQKEKKKEKTINSLLNLIS